MIMNFIIYYNKPGLNVEMDFVKPEPASTPVTSFPNPTVSCICLRNNSALVENEER